MKKHSKVISIFLSICLIVTTVCLPVNISHAASEVEVAGSTSMATANTIKVGTTYATQITAKETPHYYKFTTPNKAGYFYLESQNINVPADTNYPNANLYVVINDKYGAEPSNFVGNRHVGASLDTDWRYTEGTLEPNTTYYVKIITYNNGAFPGWIKFKLSFKSDDYANTPEASAVIGLNKTYTAASQGWQDEDWFSFKTGNSTRYELYGEVIDMDTHTSFTYSDLFFRLSIKDKYGAVKGETRVRKGDDGNKITNTFYLEPNTTYYIQAKNFYNSGAYQRLTEKGTYKFSIGKPQIKKEHVTFDIKSYTYNGKSKKPAVTVNYNGEALTKGTDYKVTYTNNINAGTAKVTVSGIGNFIGSVSKTFKIKPAKITGKTMKLSKKSYIYDGKNKKPAVTISGLKKGTDYKVTYTSYKKPGKGKVTVTGIGNYTGSKTLSYKINLKKTVLKTPVSGKKKITVKWSTVDKKYIDGYQIRYSKKSSMSNAKKTALIKRTYSKKTIKNLKAKQTYYIQIRSYNKIDGKTYYSEWSTKKKIKTK